jgi:hypothetical protein
MKMLFCSLSDRPQLSQPMFDTLQDYCNKHDYKCVLENKVLSTERAPAWSKIILLQREMKNNPDIETIVWIDDDILITNKNIKFEDLIKDYPFNNVLVSADVIWTPINSGIMVCKNNKETYDYLDTIWELCEQYPEKKWNGLWEQDIMVKHAQMNCILKPQERMPLVVIPHNIIQSFHRDHTLEPKNKWKPGHFSAHFTGMSLSKRIQYRDEVLLSLKN